MQKIEHIGIAVSNLDHGEKVYSWILGVMPYKRELVEEQGVITSFFRCGSNKIELLQSTVAGGVIDKFIEKKGEGIHHIAFAVTDILKEMERLKLLGFQLLQEEPLAGADNKWICFVHPKDTQGVLIELCQERNQ
ncbi:MAG TPA: methylmalonyl-CoA epimerase [Saprospiraceae bacterium]|nr:methylmalonyl-CoA epimerase [Saprospiraceae bacterium]